MSSTLIKDDTHFTSMPATSGNVFYWSGLALIGVAVVSGLIKPLATLARYVPLDLSEGWNAFFAQIAMRGGELYAGPAGSAIIDNYPPLSFYIVGLVGRLTVDNIFAGRALSLASTGAAVKCFAPVIVLSLLLLPISRRWHT